MRMFANGSARTIMVRTAKARAVTASTVSTVSTVSRVRTLSDNGSQILPERSRFDGRLPAGTPEPLAPPESASPAQLEYRR